MKGLDAPSLWLFKFSVHVLLKSRMTLPGPDRVSFYTAPISGRKKAHKHKLFALVNVQMALGQTAGCPRVNRAKKFMCSPRNTGNINFYLWLTGGLSQGCPDFQKVYVLPSLCAFFLPQLGPFFFCPEIRAFTGFWGEISSTASKVLSDRKALFKHSNGR